MSDCKKCNVICVDCMHHAPRSNKCHEFPIKEMNCIDGTTDCDYDLCINHNKNGNCKKFFLDEERQLKRKTIEYLDKYYWARSSHWGAHEDRGGDILHMISELKDVLEDYDRAVKPFCYADRYKRKKCRCE